MMCKSRQHQIWKRLKPSRAGLIKLLFLAIMGGALLACEKDSYLRLNANDDLGRLIPDYSTAKKFRSNSDDTIVLREIRARLYYEKISAARENGGSLGAFDFVEAERREKTLACDTPYIRINFQLRSEYEPSLSSNNRSLLQLTFDDGVYQSELNWTFADSLRCVSDRCVYVDSSMKLQYRTFNKVYLSERNPLNPTAIYINEANGIIGFKSSDNKIYELIP